MQNSNIQIRLAREEDCEKLCFISNQVNKILQENVPTHSKVVPMWTSRREHFLDDLKADDTVIFVAEKSNEVIGFASGTIETRPDDLIAVPYVRVDRIAVIEGHRSSGIGKELMTYIHNWASQKGIHVLRLAVWEFNKEAIAFYKKLGYQTVERLMEKTLD